jgi:LysM repeat protein
MSYFHKKFELSPRLKFGVGRGYSQNQVLKFSSILFLLIALGLTVNGVRLIFQDQPQDVTLTGAPQVLGASDSKDGSETDSVEFVEYKVQKGDTLFNISKNHNVSWTTLATLNNLKSPFFIKPGQTLKIPR